MKPKYKYYKREFLNKPKYHTIAFILASIEKSDGCYREYDCELSIGDCSRIINLDLDLCSNEDYKNSMYKLDKLINILSEFRDKFKESREEYLEYKEDDD